MENNSKSKLTKVFFFILLILTVYFAIMIFTRDPNIGEDFGGGFIILEAAIIIVPVSIIVFILSYLEQKKYKKSGSSIPGQFKLMSLISGLIFIPLFILLIFFGSSLLKGRIQVSVLEKNIKSFYNEPNQLLDVAFFNNGNCALLFKKYDQEFVITISNYRVINGADYNTIDEKHKSECESLNSLVSGKYLTIKNSDWSDPFSRDSHADVYFQGELLNGRFK